MTSERGPVGGAGRKSKFRKGQVVMVRNTFGEYPVLLDHETRIGTRPDTKAWFDSLHNVEYEEEMRPLTAREKGKP